MTREVRHLQPPKDFKERLHRWRYVIARRFVQFTLLVLFMGTARWGWNLFDLKFLDGDLSTSHVFNLIPLSDPFAALQRLVAQYWLSWETVLGALIVLAFYFVVSGRTFCSWVCPMNLVTDFAAWLRKVLGIKTELLHLPNWIRYVLMVLAIIVSFTSGVAAFEAFSPQAMIWREAVYGVGLGLVSAVFGILAFDFALLKRGWCGHICPLGAFWACVGKYGQVKVSYDDNTCTKCGDCLKVCPEPQVINFKKAAEKGMFVSGECTNCGKCITICPENSLQFALRCKVKK